jgi:hypothetical protein
MLQRHQDDLAESVVLRTIALETPLMDASEAPPTIRARACCHGQPMPGQSVRKTRRRRLSANGIVSGFKHRRFVYERLVYPALVVHCE